MIVKVLILARDEEKSIAKVIADIPREIVSEIVVVNNGSRDDTARAASIAGATVIDEPTPGYGAACLKGIEYLKSSPPDILVFMDGDYSDLADESVTESGSANLKCAEQLKAPLSIRN